MSGLAWRGVLSFFLVFSILTFADDFQPLFKSGKYKGKPMDVASRRSVHILERQGTTFRVEQFYHRDRWWIAEIPTDGIQQTIGQAFNFSLTGYAPVNHVQARFIMKPESPVLLTAMDGSNDTATLFDFVSSVEGVGPKGVVWNFWDAMVGNLVNAHRFASTEQIVIDRVIREGNKLSQVEVTLSDEESQHGLVQLLEDAEFAGMDQAYYLFRSRGRSANCTSTKFKAMDRTIRYRLPFQALLAHFLDELPLSPTFYLRLRGRLGKTLLPLNEEFAPLILSGAYGPELTRTFQEKFDVNGKKLPKKCHWLLAGKKSS